MTTPTADRRAFFATGIAQAILAVGSQAALADILGCTQQNVSMMLRKGFCPPKWVRAVEQASGVPRALLINPALAELLAPTEI